MTTFLELRKLHKVKISSFGPLKYTPNNSPSNTFLDVGVKLGGFLKSYKESIHLINNWCETFVII